MKNTVERDLLGSMMVLNLHSLYLTLQMSHIHEYDLSKSLRTILVIIL